MLEELPPKVLEKKNKKPKNQYHLFVTSKKLWHFSWPRATKTSPSWSCRRLRKAVSQSNGNSCHFLWPFWNVCTPNAWMADCTCNFCKVRRGGEEGAQKAVCLPTPAKGTRSRSSTRVSRLSRLGICCHQLNREQRSRLNSFWLVSPLLAKT